MPRPTKLHPTNRSSYSRERFGVIEVFKLKNTSLSGSHNNQLLESGSCLASIEVVVKTRSPSFQSLVLAFDWRFAIRHRTSRWTT